MDEDDYIMILSYLRGLVRSSDFIQFDSIASMESQYISSSKQRLEAYLGMIINMFTELSGGEANKIYDRFNRALKVENDRGFEGVKVELSGSESELYQVNSFYLHEMDDYSVFIIELKKILAELHLGPEPPMSLMSI